MNRTDNKHPDTFKQYSHPVPLHCVCPSFSSSSSFSLHWCLQQRHWCRQQHRSHHHLTRVSAVQQGEKEQSTLCCHLCTHKKITQDWGHCLCVTMEKKTLHRYYNNNNNNNNNNKKKVIIKRESLVLPELGALYRKKKGYNSTTAVTS